MSAPRTAYPADPVVRDKGHDALAVCEEDAPASSVGNNEVIQITRSVDEVGDRLGRDYGCNFGW